MHLSWAVDNISLSSHWLLLSLSAVLHCSFALLFCTAVSHCGFALQFCTLSNEWEADTFMKHKSSTVMHCSGGLRFCTAVLHCSFAPQFKLNFQWTSRGLYYRFSLNYLDCAGSRDQYPGTEEDFVCRTLLLCSHLKIENEAWTSRCSSLSSHKRGWIYKMRG